MKGRQGKRGSGEGSIYKNREGRWTAAITIGYVKGKRKRKVLYASTRSEVAAQLKKVLRDQQLGLAVATDRTTVGEFLQSWLEGIRTTVRSKTFRSYEQMVRNHLAPGRFPINEPKKHAPIPKRFPDLGLGRIRIDQLAIQDLDRFYTAKLADGCSRSLVRYLRTILRIALNDALRRGFVARNVAELSKCPKVETREIIPLDFEQANRSIDGHRLEALFQVSLAVGLRHGEALALQLPDYDANTGSLRVFHTLQRVDGHLARVETKSQKGKRIVPLPDFCVVAIEKHLIRRAEMREFAGARWRETGYLFCSTIGTPLIERNVLRDLRKVMRLAGLSQRRMHDLRHSCVTLLGAQGVPLRTIADIVGHSDIRLTQNIYQHAFMSMKREALTSMMDEILKRVATPLATETVREGLKRRATN